MSSYFREWETSILTKEERDRKAIVDKMKSNHLLKHDVLEWLFSNGGMTNKEIEKWEQVRDNGGLGT